MGGDLQTTPLTDWHRAHGARMVPFAGFDMPVQYSGIQDEVHCVRNRVGLFDLCHMGRLVLTGPDREAAADHVLSQNVARMPEDAIRYALICLPSGGVIDDVLVYRGADEVHVVINAANRVPDEAWFREHCADFDVEITVVSDRQTMLALQGQASKDTLAPLCDVDLDTLKYYRFTRGNVLGRIPALISRTGYTGEDGFELFFAREEGAAVWEALLRAGQDHGILPIGLGARDVCRTEAGMPLYGHEMDRETTPLEAGLGFGVDLQKDFIGRDALVAQRDGGLPRELIGATVEGKRIPRDGCPVMQGEREVGRVTSGTWSPTLERPIAMALVESGAAARGGLEGSLRSKRIPLIVEGLPFFSRKRKKKS
ncbi:MAG: glycine cleavage system aminomethyltransferase GcvT [Planctomycetota bacterium]|nr:glycine cleavage system aminomethyltransferase GcvT [Planctomycetota bacterium]